MKVGEMQRKLCLWAEQRQQDLEMPLFSKGIPARWLGCLPLSTIFPAWIPPIT